jgi:CubicO group peptidase (beta-lactamase class C family)
MRILVLLFVLCFGQQIYAQSYYPPKIGKAWDTMSPSQLGWCNARIDSMYEFLGNKGTKAFIVLKDGKMVLEKYYGSFTQDSLWYWASAGKSLAAAVVGIAQQEGLLNINDPVSKYLGKGWTSCPTDKEDLITIKHQLTMTSGLDYNVSSLDCTDSACLLYKEDAGNSWYYHNAPYTLIHDVVAAAASKTFNLYTYQKISAPIGMSGLWIKAADNDIYYSKARDMARFGLLVLNKGIWQNDTIFKDKTYFDAMSESSQTLNKSYGYLWWLNGKGQIVYPGLATSFNKELVPDAPKDMFAALGKNDQKLYVIPSQNMIVIRMGDAADGPVLALSQFDNDLWKWLNRLVCTPGNVDDLATSAQLYPNPTNGIVNVKLVRPISSWSLVDAFGRTMVKGAHLNEMVTLDLSIYDAGAYTLILKQKEQVVYKRIIKN